MIEKNKDPKRGLRRCLERLDIVCSQKYIFKLIYYWYRDVIERAKGYPVGLRICGRDNDRQAQQTHMQMEHLTNLYILFFGMLGHNQDWDINANHPIQYFGTQ